METAFQILLIVAGALLLAVVIAICVHLRRTRMARRLQDPKHDHYYSHGNRRHSRPLSGR